MSGYGKQILTTVSIAVMIVVVIGVGVYYAQPILDDETSISSSSLPPYLTNSNSTAITSSASTFSNSNRCSNPYVNRTTSFHVDESATIDICVGFFYYNYGSPVNISSLDQITLESNYTGHKIIDSNFTVSANPSSFLIGGNSSQNEGTVVEYQIHANANSSGTYILDFGFLLPQKQDCWVEYELSVGTGLPNYANIISLCYTFLVTSTSSLGQNPSFPLPTGILFAEVSGYTN